MFCVYKIKKSANKHGISLPLYIASQRCCSSFTKYHCLFFIQYQIPFSWVQNMIVLLRYIILLMLLRQSTDMAVGVSTCMCVCM